MNAAVSLIEGGALEIVPSSNPASQAFPESEEALWLVTQAKGKGDSCLVDDFTKAPLQTSSEGHESLQLEEMVVSCPVHQFRRHMPTLQAKLSRLKGVLLPDPLQIPMGGSLSEELIFGRCVPYDASCCDADSSQMGSSFVEEYSKVPPREEESLMLLEVESCTILKASFSMSLAYLSRALQVCTEPEADLISSVDMLKNATPAGLQEIHAFVAPNTPDNSMNPFPPEDSQTPAPLRLYPELELDEVFSSDNGPRLPALHLPTSHLQPEHLPPVYGHYLVSDSEREEMERGLWMAEKHHNSRASFLLAEPPRRKHFVQKRPLAEAFQVLAIPTSTQLVAFAEQPQILLKDHPNFVEKGAPQPLSLTKRYLVEDFTVLSGIEIDDILRGTSEDVGKSKIAETSAKPPQPPATSLQQGDVQQLAVSSQQEDGKAVKKLIMERMEWPSDISSPSQEHRPQRTLQGTQTTGEERVGNAATVRGSHPEFPSRSAAPKLLSHFDLLDSFIMLRQQQGMLEASEANTTLTGLQLNMFTNQRSTEQRPGERGQQKAMGPVALSGPPERASTLVAQGTQSNTAVRQASRASGPAGQASRVSALTGQASRGTTPASQVSSASSPAGQASGATIPAGQVSRASTVMTQDKRDDRPVTQGTRSVQDNNLSRVIPVQATGTLAC
ncbi:hypothetical protein ACEWY4_011614 [Coilia grayii]|uniref:Uncharacterized protein n=1 Tax=Coilia grayii TaxID=363190 RepID=A0ABD1JYB3_9TELE